MIASTKLMLRKGHPRYSTSLNNKQSSDDDVKVTL